MSDDLDYEAAVYRDDVDALALAIKAAIEEKTAHVTDARIRRAVVAAGTVTALQLLDGASLETNEPIHDDGFAEAVLTCLISSEWRQGS